MKLRLLMATTIAAVAFSSANAKSDQGSYYGKVNLGYGTTEYKFPGITLKGKGLLGSAALGYQFSNNLRSELELYMDDGLPKKKDGAKLEVKTIAALVNLAFDFKNSSKITPFVMAGVGYGRDKLKLSYLGYELGSKSKNRVKFQLGAGLGFAVDKNINLEVAYKGLHKGYSDVRFVHAGTVGVRVNF